MKLPSAFVLTVLLGTPAVAQDLAPVALNSLSATPAAIASAQIFDERGKAIGRFQKMVEDQDGKPAAISFVADTTGRLVIVPASAVSYDEQKNILVADTSSQQLAQNAR
jgi:hypothetical protein